MRQRKSSELYKETYKNLRKVGYTEKESYRWILKTLPKCNKNATVGKCLRELVRESSKEVRVY